MYIDNCFFYISQKHKWKSKSVLPTISYSHCSTAMSTRLAWHSGFFAWFMLLWPGCDHISSRINFIRGAFWEINQFVVTWPKSLKIWIGQFLLALFQSKKLFIKLWPGLKFWHWPLYNQTPISNSIGLFLVTCQKW